MDQTLKKLLSGKAISSRELSQLCKSPQGIVALAALQRAHLNHQEATAELKRPPRQVGKERTAQPGPESKRALKSTKHRKV